MPEQNFEADIHLVHQEHVHKWKWIKKDLRTFSPYNLEITRHCAGCNKVERGVTYDQYKEPDNWTAI